MNANSGAFDDLVRQLEPRAQFIRMWRLEGGVSRRVTAVEAQDAGGRCRRFVVYQYGNQDFKELSIPPEAEYRLLEFLRARRVPVPAPLYAGPTDDEDSGGCLVVEYVEGEGGGGLPQSANVLAQLAEKLRRIHEVSAPRGELPYLPTLTARGSSLLSRIGGSKATSRACEVLSGVWPLPPRNPEVLLHGDFWLGNTLWDNGQLVAVLDWEDASLGDPLADVAGTRLELCWAFGEGAMEEFTALYRSLASFIDWTDLPYWDLLASLHGAAFAEWGLSPTKVDRFAEKHDWFIADAIRRTGRRS